MTRLWSVVGVFLDGKSFAVDQVITALTVTEQGDNVIPGFVQASSENEKVGAA